MASKQVYTYTSKRLLSWLKSQVDFKFRGLVAGVFTPFKEDLSLNIEIIPQYAKFLADEGVHGVLINGTTSEGPAMTVQERKTLAEAWLSAVKQTKQHLMVQVGGCPLPDAQELARHAENLGAASLLCLPELYFKPKTPQELIDYLKLISKAAPNTPLLFYHNPARTGVNLNMEQFLNQSVGQIPTFHGIKFASKDLSEAYDALKAADGRYTVFLATDRLIQPALALGFDSFNTTSINIIPGYHVKLVNAVKENRTEDARKIQENLSAALKVILKDGDWTPAMKAAMNILTPIKVGPPRPPQKILTEAQKEEMAKNLEQYAS